MNPNYQGNGLFGSIQNAQRGMADGAGQQTNSGGLFNAPNDGGENFHPPALPLGPTGSGGNGFHSGPNQKQMPFGGVLGSHQNLYNRGQALGFNMPDLDARGPQRKPWNGGGLDPVGPGGGLGGPQITPFVDKPNPYGGGTPVGGPWTPPGDHQDTYNPEGGGGPTMPGPPQSYGTPEGRRLFGVGGPHPIGPGGFYPQGPDMGARHIPDPYRFDRPTQQNLFTPSPGDGQEQQQQMSPWLRNYMNTRRGF